MDILTIYIIGVIVAIGYITEREHKLFLKSNISGKVKIVLGWIFVCAFSWLTIGAAIGDIRKNLKLILILMLFLISCSHYPSYYKTQHKYNKTCKNYAHKL